MQIRIEDIHDPAPTSAGRGTYLLLAYLKFSSKLNCSLQAMLRLLQLNLFIRRDLMALLRGDPPDKTDLKNNRQLALV